MTSSQGYCGSTDAYCGAGCNYYFGGYVIISSDKVSYISLISHLGAIL